MSESEQPPVVKIAVVGPSRVGKTSVINAILEQGKAALAGTPATLTAIGQTRGRLNVIRNQLLGAVNEGSFESAGIRSNNERLTYEIRMDAGGSQARLDFLDYPGRWMMAADNSPKEEEEWAKCQDFIHDSPVLVIPIDSAVLMEARTASEKSACATILQIAGVEDVVEAWAKRRQERVVVGEPRVLALVPIKCEAYLNDNGGNRDEGKRLFHLVEKYYQRVIGVALANCADTQILYAPIDTYGCTTLISAQFPSGGEAPSFKARYRFRSREPRMQPMGADTLLGVIAKETVIFATSFAQGEAEKSTEAQRQAQQAATPSGLGQRIMWWFNGEGKQRAALADAAAGVTRDKRKLLDSWLAIMEHFAQVEPRGRSAWIKDRG